LEYLISARAVAGEQILQSAGLQDELTQHCNKLILNKFYIAALLGAQTPLAPVDKALLNSKPLGFVTPYLIL